MWSTGARVRRRSWTDGPYDEELVVTPEAVRLDRLNAGAPLLNTHASWSLADVIGNVVPGSARIVGGEGVCRAALSKAPGDADIVQKIRDGNITNISVGYRIHKVEKIEGLDGAPALWRVVDWEPFEISAVPIPADPGAQFRSEDGADQREAPAGAFPCLLVEPDRSPVRRGRAHPHGDARARRRPPGLTAPPLPAATLHRGADERPSSPGVTLRNFTMKRPFRAVAFLSVGAVLSLALLAVAVFALSGGPGGDLAGLAGLFHDPRLLLASPVLISLRATATDLEARAAAKLAEVKDGLDGEALRRIESEHTELLRQLEATRGQIAAYEAAPPLRRPPPTPRPPSAPSAIGSAKSARSAGARPWSRARIDAAVDAATPVESFRARAFDVVADRAKAKPTSAIAETRGGQDETDTRREAMIEYVL